MELTDSTRKQEKAANNLRLLTGKIIYMTVFIGLIGTVLFLSAGRLDWPAAWGFLLSYYFISLTGALWLHYSDPSLAQERSRKAKNTKPFDRVILPLNLLLTLLC